MRGNQSTTAKRESRHLTIAHTTQNPLVFAYVYRVWATFPDLKKNIYIYN